MQAFYDKSTTFKSDFQQKFWVKAYNHEKTSSGHVTFAKPGKMEWVYDDPKDNRVVSDGKIIRVYEASNKQMFEQPVDTTQYPAALSFLTGTGKLTDSFDFELFPGAEMKFPGGLRPRRDAQGSRRPRTRRSSSTSTRRRPRSGGSWSSTARATATASTS